MQQILEHITLDLHQILHRQQFLNFIHIFLPILLILQRTQYLEIQLTFDPFILIAFLYLLLMLLKLLKDLKQLILLLRQYLRERVDATEIETEQKALEVETEDVVNDIRWG